MNVTRGCLKSGGGGRFRWIAQWGGNVKRLLVAAVIAVAAFAVAGASAAPPSFRLQPSAGNYSPKFDFAKQTGNGTFSQAQWTNTQAHSGKFSVLLQKSVDYF